MREVSLGNRSYYGIEYLRAIMVIAVIVWHTKLFGGLNLSIIDRYSSGGITLPVLMCFNFLLLAVPTFYLISLFLFSTKVRAKKSYFTGRIERLIYLYIFWTGLFVLIRYRCEFDTVVAILSSSTKDIVSFFAGQGISAFFFFFSLILLTFISRLCIMLPRFILWVLLAASTSLLWIFPIIVISQSAPADPDFYQASLIVYWNPLNFLPYVFISALVSELVQKESFNPSTSRFRRTIGLLSFVFIATAVCEWLWIVHRSNVVHSGYIPSYMRISVAAGASLFFLSSFFIRRAPGRLVSFLSKYSLGMYCLHPFVMGAYIELKGEHQGSIYYTASILVTSALGAYLFRRAFSKRLI
jgi:hypothetical protein